MLHRAMGVAVSCLAIAGCQNLFAPRGIPDDPLVLSRQPIESKGQVTAARPIMHVEPVPPSPVKRSDHFAGVNRKLHVD